MTNDAPAARDDDADDIYLATGLLRKAVEDFWSQHAAACDRIERFEEERGCKLVVRGNSAVGAVFDGDPPGWWIVHKGKALSSGQPFYRPDARTKEGKADRKHLREKLSRPSVHSLHFTMCRGTPYAHGFLTREKGPSGWGQLVRFISPEQVADMVFLHVPAGMSLDHPDAQKVARSEYWRLRENVEAGEDA